MNDLIVKDNILVTSSYRLGEVSQRVMLLAIIQARNITNDVNELVGKELTISAKEYMEFFKVDKSTAYRCMKKGIIELFNAEWGYKTLNKKGEVQIAKRRFIQSADYIENGAAVRMKFADDTVPFLVQLEKNFTSYNLKQVSNLSSSYAIRFYEIFMRYLDKKTNTGWLKISLEELRFSLGLLESEYTRLDNLKKRVIESSLNEINEKTDLTIAYEQEKKGKSVSAFIFTFTRKVQNKQRIEKKEEPKKVKAQRATLVSLKKQYSDDEQEIIYQQAEKHIKRKTLENNGAELTDFHKKNIIYSAFKDGWGIQDYRKEKAAKNVQKERELADEKELLARYVAALSKEIEKLEQEEKNELIKKAYELMKKSAMWARIENHIKEQKISDDDLYKDIYCYRYFIEALKQMKEQKEQKARVVEVLTEEEKAERKKKEQELRERVTLMRAERAEKFKK